MTFLQRCDRALFKVFNAWADTIVPVTAGGAAVGTAVGGYYSNKDPGNVAFGLLAGTSLAAVWPMWVFVGATGGAGYTVARMTEKKKKE